MPAVTVPDIMVLPRLARPDVTLRARPVRSVVTAHKQREGAGFEVRRPFPSMDLRAADPFILLDQMGPSPMNHTRRRARPGIRTAASKPSPTCSTAPWCTTTRRAEGASSARATPSG